MPAGTPMRTTKLGSDIPNSQQPPALQSAEPGQRQLRAPCVEGRLEKAEEEHQGDEDHGRHRRENRAPSRGAALLDLTGDGAQRPARPPSESS